MWQRQSLIGILATEPQSWRSANMAIEEEYRKILERRTQEAAEQKTAAKRTEQAQKQHIADLVAQVRKFRRVCAIIEASIKQMNPELKDAGGDLSVARSDTDDRIAVVYKRTVAGPKRDANLQIWLTKEGRVDASITVGRHHARGDERKVAWTPIAPDSFMKEHANDLIQQLLVEAEKQ
jgi:hypothetical protein